MTIVERNDVDISRLFIWGKEFEITDNEGNVQAKLYMRLLGDADVNRARVYALRKSREMRLKLSDYGSDERLIYIKMPNELSHDELIGYVLMFSMREITQKAFKEVNVPAPKMPKSNASLKKMEQYQKEIDDYPDKLQDAIREYTKKEAEKLKNSLTNESDDILYKKYVDLLVDEFCDQEALIAYNDMELFLGCYKDPEYKTRAWESFVEFENLPKEIKLQFRAAYDSIKVGMEDLKKLREATQ